MDYNTQLNQVIRASGFRMTKQRRLILDVIAESSEHLDADSIHDKVKLHYPRISLATVYRTLSLLKKMNLVREHRLGEGHGHFEAVKEVPHYHFTCRRCNRVIEFEAPYVREITKNLIDQHGISVTEVHLFIGGYCAECKSLVGSRL